MRTIERSTKFKKDYKRELKGRYRDILESELKTILVPLINDEALDIRYRDHDLSGNWAGYRECHIKPDLLLIYRKLDGDILKLARLGSHSELFS
ncbi:type II toxin-antitoxin system YafQ family toxin [Legionella israelensis]|uniref:mRNA interferase YafQ n=1 Tax=Legionella israelensis TaxID=454 RepID=A0A0W0VH57_9GAMM|nr:type II toxin-antitoxin system YafQ family toxin [Legionella israelensis]KTD19509.1 mRNA interferase YafQ [Legionella israelensis]QBS11210.1 type II toxin-antitoxin system YafQ family toxin [Legionella israelensis]SCY57677.1 mRNA interferase YafQ [Legionella israelensis DSM 19235]STX61053.1 addiction module toxin, RelE/StbE family [Legionella israelensis]